jgi:hypothetical protein
MAIVITLFLFFSSSSLGGWDEISASFGFASEMSLWTPDDDFSSDNTVGPRSLKRSQRGKSSLKSLAAANKPARTLSVIVRIRETPLISPYSKSSLYQQVNVYRI